MNRRGFLGALAVLTGAPAIIRTPGLLMPVREWVPPPLMDLRVFGYDPFGREVETGRYASSELIPRPDRWHPDGGPAHELKIVLPWQATSGRNGHRVEWRYSGRDGQRLQGAELVNVSGEPNVKTTFAWLVPEYAI